jgi:hypothetical protein
VVQAGPRNNAIAQFGVADPCTMDAGALVGAFLSAVLMAAFAERDKAGRFAPCRRMLASKVVLHGQFRCVHCHSPSWLVVLVCLTLLILEHRFVVTG